MNLRDLPLLALALLLARRLDAQTAQAAPVPPASLPFTTRALDPRGLGIVADAVSDKAFVFDTAQDRILAAVHITNRNALCDVVIDRKREFAYLTTVGSEIAILDLRGPVPVRASGTNPIRMQAVGCDLALTPDQRFLIATGPAGGNFRTSVVDVASRAELSWADFGSTPAVEAYGDGSVLLTTQQGILWFSIDATGALVLKGAPLIQGGFNLLRAPDGNTAVVFDQFMLFSFSAGLQQISQSHTVFTFPASTSFAFDATGRWLFVRRNSFGGGGTLEKLGYQAGLFAPVPEWVVPLAPAGVSQYGLETIAVDDVQGKLYATEPTGIGIFSMASGARLGSLTDPELTFPMGIDVVDAAGR